MFRSKAMVTAAVIALSLAGVSESLAQGRHGGGGHGGGGGPRFSGGGGPGLGGGGGGARFMGGGGGGGGGAMRFGGGPPRMAAPNFNRPAMAAPQFRTAGAARFAGPGGPGPGMRSGHVWRGGPIAGHHRHHHHHRRFIGPGLGFVAGLAVGSAYASSPYYYNDPYYYDQGYYAAPAVSNDIVAACMQQYGFVSYDPATNTYLGADGVRYQCDL